MEVDRSCAHLTIKRHFIENRKTFTVCKTIPFLFQPSRNLRANYEIITGRGLGLKTGVIKSTPSLWRHHQAWITPPPPSPSPQEKASAPVNTFSGQMWRLSLYNMAQIPCPSRTVAGIQAWSWLCGSEFGTFPPLLQNFPERAQPGSGWVLFWHTGGSSAAI